MLPLPNGTLVVSDRSSGTVDVVDPARKTGRVLARVVEAPELERLPGGRILV